MVGFSFSVRALALCCPSRKWTPRGALGYIAGGFRRSGRNYVSPEGVWRVRALGSSVSLENVVAL